MNPYSLAPLQELEATYPSGVAGDGTLAATSFWTWNGDYPPTYGQLDAATKWGAHTAGAGATVSYSFDQASNWSATEQQAFQAGMSLWSAVADIHFTQVASAADFTIARGASGAAEVSFQVADPGTVGGSHLGTQVGSALAIDTGVPGFGPIGAPFSVEGGAPWTTLEHELGHIIGLGHSGAYNEDGGGQTSGPPVPLSSLDSLAYSLMSYVVPSPSNNSWAVLTPNGAAVVDSPTTPMMFDILAAQRLYGVATDTPLSGGQVFGFNCNIVGSIEPFFDFTKNQTPVLTLWDAGTNNVLDLSGFGTPSTVNLSPGGFTSADGLTNNIAIGIGVQIDEAIGGAGDDQMFANSDGDTLIGGGGSDTLNGSYGHDLILGNSGDDRLQGYDQGDTLFGGSGNDLIFGTGRLSGDLGDDQLIAGEGSTVSGGAGVDTLHLSDDDTVVDTRANLSGDILVGFTHSDVIHVTDGSPGDGYALVSNDLDLGGGAALHLSAVPSGSLVIAADPTGGVDLSIAAPAAPPSGFDGAVLIPFRSNTASLSDFFFTERVGEREGYFHTEGYQANYVQNLGVAWQVQGTADFSGDGAPDLIWRNTETGVFTIWDGQAPSFQQNTFVSSPIDGAWIIAGFGDFDGDGKSDILWRNAVSGVITQWRSTGPGFIENSYVDASVNDTNWKVAAIADFDGDGKSDILWRNSVSEIFTEWKSTGSGFVQNVYVDSSVGDASWQVAGTGDFDGDGKADLLWRNSVTGVVTVWTSTGTGFRANTFVDASMHSDQQIVAVADATADGRADIVWSDQQGDYTVWSSNGAGFDAHGAGFAGAAVAHPSEYVFGLV